MASNETLRTFEASRRDALPQDSGSIDRFPVAGVGVDALTRPRLLEELKCAVEGRSRRRVVFCNTSSVVAANHGHELREAINQAEIVSPDGMPLVWLGKLGRKQRRMERVDGPSFMRQAMEHGLDYGWRHYLYGSTPEVLEALQARLRDEVRGVQIVGAASPAFGEEAPARIGAEIEAINESGADFVWIGLGMPKQELWMARYHQEVNAPVLLGVGAAFDFQAGLKRRAPRWMQRTGMEWLHRLAQEPRRLWRRYLIGNLEFGYLVARQAVSGPGSR